MATVSTLGTIPFKFFHGKLERRYFSVSGIADLFKIHITLMNRRGLPHFLMCGRLPKM
jgi:hypothetical protein